MDAYWTELTHHGLLAFEGEDARAFLHGQLTCDVAGLPDRRSTYGAYCTPKGRVLGNFLLWVLEGRFVMQLPRTVAAPLQKRLSMYVLRSKVRAADTTQSYVQYGLAGPGAAAAIATIVGSSPHAPHDMATGNTGFAIRLPLERYLLVVPAEQREKAATILAATAQRPQSWWESLDIAAGIATVLPQTQEQFVPQMLNLDAIGGVSFTKGCYPGQEIVARMHYLGRLKERLFRARVAAADAPQPGDKVYGVDLGNQACGMIVNGASAGNATHELLAVMRLGSVAAGPVRLGATDGPVLEIEDLPYALPER